MGNQWFRFKQFTIKQEKTAMKVGTDGVLLGVWANVPQTGKILDVGTGTGLISLMMAQRTEGAIITGVDIDKDACEQAKENVRESKWAGRICIVNSSLQHFAENSIDKFDFIISNPPFFDGTKTPKNQQRTIARHGVSLSVADFFSSSVFIMEKNARLALIVPSGNLDEAKKAASQFGLHLNRLMNVKPIPEKLPHRALAEFSFMKNETIVEEMILETGGRHNYSKEYEALTRDFYLFFD